MPSIQGSGRELCRLCVLRADLRGADPYAYTLYPALKLNALSRRPCRPRGRGRGVSGLK